MVWLTANERVALTVFADLAHEFRCRAIRPVRLAVTRQVLAACAAGLSAVGERKKKMSKFGDYKYTKQAYAINDRSAQLTNPLSSCYHSFS